MHFFETNLKDAYVIEPVQLPDDRGMFARVFCKNEYKKTGLKKEFVQFNHSFNKIKGTFRGMHYQQPPYAEEKLIRCIRGAVYDVIVDIRKFSDTFLNWFGVILSAENMKMIYVPEGFAHGFLTLEDNSELLYHHTEFYVSGAERGIRYNDKRIGIQWLADVRCISEKDKNYLPLSDNFIGIEI